MATSQELGAFADAALAALTEAKSGRDLSAYRTWAGSKLFLSAEQFFSTPGPHKAAADTIRADYAKVLEAEDEAAAPAQEPDVMAAMMAGMRDLMGKMGEMVAGMEMHAALKAGQDAVKPEEPAAEEAPAAAPAKGEAAPKKQ